MKLDDESKDMWTELSDVERIVLMEIFEDKLFWLYPDSAEIKMYKVSDHPEYRPRTRHGAVIGVDGGGTLERLHIINGYFKVPVIGGDFRELVHMKHLSFRSNHRANQEVLVHLDYWTGLETFSMSGYKNVQILAGAPFSVKHLNIDNTDMSYIPSLPKAYCLETYALTNSKISDIQDPEFPEDLKVLDIRGNRLKFTLNRWKNKRKISELEQKGISVFY